MFLLLKEKLASAVADAAGVSVQEAAASIGLPKGQFGDVASSICFSLAKRDGRNPAELARNLAGKIRLPDWVEHAVATGPYVNFMLSDSFYSALLAKANAEKEHFGRGRATEGKTIVEFPSVNPNKPWHIGHLRNALLGDAVQQ